ncbi:hypothetical protein [Aeromicrobium wangtongii]|uniref:hypothetical protein n=1 Tax=Aeromicrobium wangtongii TaxID=2969247 RepID=UPI0020173096|nr:hypothetical protein [Aeromicrobium wangtongii]MCL3816898.1 hypothetical protein [Aeromicrobium wangtongii]
MNFLLGGGKRALVVAFMLALSGLSACSSNDAKKADPKPVATTSATPDQAAADQAAVSDLVTRYWAAEVRAQNSGDDSPEQFSDVARGGFIERTLKSIRDAKADGVMRQGQPEVTDIEVAVTGDTADIRACLDEDDWIFVKDGKDLGFEKDGSGPWGAEATRTADAWVISDVRVPPAGEKSC